MATVADLLSWVRGQLGKNYVFGTAGPDTYDCSGLVTAAFRQFGVNLPHHSEDQATYGTAVDKGSIQAGDLVFSDWGDGPNSHVGIAVGDGKIIDAPHTGAVVRYDDLTSGYLAHVTAVRRIPLGGGAAGGGTGSGGGAAGGGAGGGGGLLSRFEGALNTIERTFTGPYNEIAQPLQDIGSAATEMAGIGDKLLKLFLPSNFLRVVSGLAGAILIIFGIWMLTLEARG